MPRGDSSEQSAGSRLRVCQILIDGLQNANALADVFDLCSSMRDGFKFDYFCYVAQFSLSFVKPKTVVLSDFPEPWRQTYDSNGYASLDPTVEHCRNETTPLVWGPASIGDNSLDQKTGRFFGDADSHGLNHGISVPVHGSACEWGMLSLAKSSPSTSPGDAILRSSLYAMLAAAHIQTHIKRLTGEQVPSGKPFHLTAREKQCLQWAAEGKTTWETARILNITESTAVFHFQNAAKKLDVANRTQAVARAISMHLIDMESIRLTEDRVDNKADYVLLTGGSAARVGSKTSAT